LLRIFFFGILLGLVAAAGALYAVPAVDQQREVSIVKVAPNGGNVERFHINVPMDRILVGGPGQTKQLPPGVEWPSEKLLSDTRVELFKIRNVNDIVVGVASRTAAARIDENVIDWVLHLPARGSFFVNLEAAPHEDGFRIGKINSGSREFESLTGFITERWVANDFGEKDVSAGRIELTATYAGKLESLE
jgi:hypothetical protein